MVDVSLLQSLSYTAGAISVVLGVIYYGINLRETTRNRRVTLASNLLSTINCRGCPKEILRIDVYAVDGLR